MNPLILPLAPLRSPCKGPDASMRRFNMLTSSFLTPFLANAFHSFSLAGYGYSTAALLLPELFFSINVSGSPQLHKLQVLLHQSFSTALLCLHVWFSFHNPNPLSVSSTILMGLYTLATDCHSSFFMDPVLPIMTQKQKKSATLMRLIRHSLSSLLYFRVPQIAPVWQHFYYRTQFVASITTVAIIPLQEILRPTGKQVVKTLRQRRRRRTTSTME